MHLQKRRNDGLDLLRAAAITFVLMDHFGAMVFHPPLTGQLVFTFAGATGVDIFFALSGFPIGRIQIVAVNPDFDPGACHLRASAALIAAPSGRLCRFFCGAEWGALASARIRPGVDFQRIRADGTPQWDPPPVSIRCDKLSESEGSDG